MDDPATVAAAETAREAETNRDRVRRCLFTPLGFRFPKGTPEDEGRRRLDEIADELAYMTEDQLVILAKAVKPLGDGAARSFWPPRATFIGWAHAIAPMPLDRDPKLLSWFGSIEGPRAAEAGALVETFDWFAEKRLPPVTDQARRIVAEKAAANARRLELIADRRRHELPTDPDELRWEAWYLGRRAYLEKLMRTERARRGHPVAEARR